MKDFYKILSLKEDASEEEIRERWIELTKQYHPDRSEDTTSEEKIREINEAYQVLKHSSTRVEYDLKRTYGQGEKESKRRSYFKKLGLPVGIVIMVMMIGTFYLRTSRNKISETGETSPQNSITQLPNDLTTNRRSAPVVQEPMAASTHQPMTASTHEPVAASTQQTRPAKEAISGARPKGHRDAMPQRSKGPAVPTDKTIQTGIPIQKPLVASIPKPIEVPTQQPHVAKSTPAVPVVNPTNARNTINSINAIAQSPGNAVKPAAPVVVTPQKKELHAQLPGSITQSPNDLTIHQPPYSTNSLHPKIALAQLKPPTLVATEDEVKKFFNNYIKYYDRKEVKGILSLFSSKAIQNQKDGLEQIQKIYIDFFNEVQGIRFSLQDVKIEIYQNAAEVKARYEIEQILKTSGEREVWRGPVRWILIKEDGKLKILSVDYKYGRAPSGKKEESDEAS